MEYVVLGVQLSLWTESTTGLFVCIWSHPTVQTVDKPHAIAVDVECGSGTRESNTLTCSDPLKIKNKVDKSQDSQMYCQAHAHCIMFLVLIQISTPLIISVVFMMKNIFHPSFLFLCKCNNEVMISHVLVKQRCSLPRTAESHVWLTAIHLFPSNDYYLWRHQQSMFSYITYQKLMGKRCVQQTQTHTLLSRFRWVCTLQWQLNSWVCQRLRTEVQIVKSKVTALSLNVWKLIQILPVSRLLLGCS